MRIFVLSKTLTGTLNGSLPTMFNPLEADKGLACSDNEINSKM